MVFDEQRMVQRFLQKCNFEAHGVSRLDTSYSNHVFVIITDNGDFVYKEYIRHGSIIDKDNELSIQRQLDFPEIWHVEPEFRIEKYYLHRKVKFVEDLKQIAVKLSEFHAKRIESFIWQGDYLDILIKKNECIANLECVRRVHAKVKKVIGEPNTFVICHNDLQIGNMMNYKGEIKFIDFEYACMGNALLDISNLFCETMTNYDNDCVLKRERGYTEEQKKQFCQVYFKKEDVDKEMAKIAEAEIYSHFFWFLWGRMLHITKFGPNKNFDYMAYALNRLQFIVDAGYLTREEAETIRAHN